MPYIKKEYRDEIKAGIVIPATAGELNYQFTECIVNYIRQCGMSYQTVNDIVGALEGAKLEFYRRVAAPYEEEAIQRNGDVYT